MNPRKSSNVKFPHIAAISQRESGRTARCVDCAMAKLRGESEHEV